MRTLRALALSLTISASLPMYALSVKHNPEAAAGCMGRVSLADAGKAMEDFNIRQTNATEEEVETLGTALTWIERLNGGKPLQIAVADASAGYTFHFLNEKGHSQQTLNGIMLRRNGDAGFGRNVAQLVHELGHFIGNKGEYQEYREATKGAYCVVSGYSDDKSNEQFAEAFAAFVTYPALMKAIDSPGCKRAYDFFANRVFAQGELADQCAADQNKKAGHNN